MKNAWAQFWSKPWKVKGPVLGVAAFVVLAIAGAAGGGEEEVPDTSPASADETTESTTSDEKATNTPKATETVKPTNTPKPTETPRPTPTTEERFLASYKDNKGFMTRATEDDIKLAFNSDGVVTIDLHPKSVISEGDILTITGASAIVANRALWTTYPEVNVIVVQVWNEFTSPTGQKSDEIAAGITTTRATSVNYGYDGLKDRQTLDNKNFFCVADQYQIHPSIYVSLGDKGCLAVWGFRKN